MTLKEFLRANEGDKVHWDHPRQPKLNGTITRLTNRVIEIKWSDNTVGVHDLDDPTFDNIKVGDRDMTPTGRKMNVPSFEYSEAPPIEVVKREKRRASDYRERKQTLHRKRSKSKKTKKGKKS